MEENTDSKKKFDKIVSIIVALFVIVILVIVLFVDLKEKKETKEQEEERTKIVYEEREIPYAKVLCMRSLSREGYSLNINISSNYRNSVVQNTDITYTTQKNFSDVTGSYEFPEVKELESALKFDGVTKKTEGDVVIYSIDYSKEFDAMFDDNVLKKYMYPVGAELRLLADENFYCTQETKVVIEKVYIENGLKYEE